MVFNVWLLRVLSAGKLENGSLCEREAAEGKLVIYEHTTHDARTKGAHAMCLRCTSAQGCCRCSFSRVYLFSLGTNSL
jgi:hypothetical protein